MVNCIGLTKILVLVLGFWLLPACTNNNLQDEERKKTMASKTIEQVLKEHTEELMSLPGVVGVGQGLCDDQDCIKVFVAKMTPELKQKIPNELAGYQVDIEVTGEFRALPEK